MYWVNIPGLAKRAGNDPEVNSRTGLSGEIRPVPDGAQRLKEAAGHGYTTAFVPLANQPRKAIKGLNVVGVSHVAGAIEKIV